MKGPKIIEKVCLNGEIYFAIDNLNQIEKDFILEALDLLYKEKRELDINVQQNFNAFKNLLGFNFIDNSCTEVDRLEYLIMLLENSEKLTLNK